MDIAIRVLLDAPLNTDIELERAGSSLENPYVYDAVARALADRGPEGGVEVLASEIDDVGGERLITRFRFRRLR